MSEVYRIWADGKHKFLVNYLLFFYAVFFFFFINHKFFGQVQPMYFRLEPDLPQLFVLATGIPKWLVLHPGAYVWLDVVVLLFPAAIVAYYYRNNKFNLVLGVSFTAYLMLYFLLQSALLNVSLHPCVPYVILSGMFWCNSDLRFQLVLKVARFIVLYMFASAAMWKILRGALIEPQQMSYILMEQHANYMVSDCNAWICSFHTYLIQSPVLSQTLYIVATLLEMTFIAGFFTRKYDKLLVLLLIVFVVFNQIIMRIPYWAILVSAITLWESISDYD